MHMEFNLQSLWRTLSPPEAENLCRFPEVKSFLQHDLGKNRPVNHAKLKLSGYVGPESNLPPYVLLDVEHA